MVPVSFVDCMNLVAWHFLPKNFRTHRLGSFILVKGSEWRQEWCKNKHNTKHRRYSISKIWASSVAKWGTIIHELSRKFVHVARETISTNSRNIETSFIICNKMASEMLCSKHIFYCCGSTVVQLHANTEFLPNRVKILIFYSGLWYSGLSLMIIISIICRSEDMHAHPWSVSVPVRTLWRRPTGG